MKQWTAIVGSGLLAAISLATQAWSGPGRGGSQVDINSLLGTDVSANPQLALDRVESEFLAGQVSDSTRATLEKEMVELRILGAKLEDPATQVNLGLITGLVLGSPEFLKL